MPVAVKQSLELWITKCGSKLIYETLPKKEVVYVLPITSILGRLPVIRAGDTGTIPFSYLNVCSNGAHRYDHALAKADIIAGAGDGCSMYFVNFWALGWCRNPLLRIITYYCLNCYYLLLPFLLLLCSSFYITITYYYIIY